MPFRSYCDTFWDLKDQSDESVNTCRSWVCAQDEYQCGTGPCIPKYYVCDGEWDCADALDDIFDMNRISDHNRMLVLQWGQVKCAMMLSNAVQAFHNSCNITTEYSCLLIEFVRPSDILNTRPCTNISQTGDGKIDCLGGLDARNTQTHCHAMYQLGFAFQCRSAPNTCIDEQNLCINRCPELNDDSLLCSSNYSIQSDATYSICMNGTHNGRECTDKQKV